MKGIVGNGYYMLTKKNSKISVQSVLLASERREITDLWMAHFGENS